MTLIQVLADETHIYMSGDFRLTDIVSRRRVSDEAHKLVRIASSRVSAYIGVTGLGSFGSEPIGLWIARSAAAAGPDATWEDFIEVLQDARVPLASIGDAELRRHTFVVAAMLGTQSSISLVSNFEELRNGQVIRSDLARDELRVTTFKPKGPTLVIEGAYGSVSDTDRKQLLLSLRKGSASEVILESLARSNRAAHTRDGSVSEGCYTATLDATGRGSSRPFLSEDHVGDFIPPGSNQMVQGLLLRVQRVVGPDGRRQPIRLVQSAQVVKHLSSEKDFGNSSS